ncbi:MAG: hypothetical protein EXX96DRAFT_546977 [Benjaminiella poitrasii]|nr:MAG: hypothetical protein EXX96DRAFT_546977 [Benjaminiella poitrasii]
MLTAWLSSWYNGNNVQQAFIDSNEQYGETTTTTTTEEGDWVEIISATSSTKELKQHQSTKSATNNEPVIATTTIDSCDNNKTKTNTNSNSNKQLSRQERRAKARLAIREEKKQARKAAMTIKRSNSRITTKGLASTASVSSCLPSAPLTTAN